MRWRVQTGVPWRDLPGEYGLWQTVYGLFRRWRREGVWARIPTLLQTRADAAGLITWEVGACPRMVDRPRRPHRGGPPAAVNQQPAETAVSC
ncbi:transposase [Streptomyces sp. NPDC058872]|uniref:transposase n=1 Tax=Streptomyces sp. NPDC058872 TaxID=3346661 RepID=UPI0036B4AAD3